MSRNWIQSFQVAAVYVGTVVGAGFATGREIVEFFSQYGFLGMAGICVAGSLFIMLGTKMLLISKRIKARSFQDLNVFLFGRTFGGFVNVLVLVALLCITSIMLSGAGAIFEEQLEISKQVGILLTIALAVSVMVFGVKGLFSVNLLVVPMLILFSLMVAFQSLSSDLLNYSQGADSASLKWLVAAFSYAAFNLALSAAVLVPLANEMEDEQVLKRGGILGGILLTIILLGSYIALSTLPQLHTYDIPMAEVMKTTFYSFYFIYVAVIYGEVFTSVIGNLFGLERQLIQYLRLPRMIIVIMILFISYFISQLGYSSLISFLYPIIGYVSLGFLFLLSYKKVPKQW
ncbi:hypothetical protein ACFFIX_03820 [Metabacillus herbersteinensis]|uniref:Transporter n=1 Tax=Metabacillus herbersteinensis TaxID=283816 RepID=A0ABV6GCC0_9BACI